MLPCLNSGSNLDVNSGLNTYTEARKDRGHGRGAGRGGIGSVIQLIFPCFPLFRASVSKFGSKYLHGSTEGRRTRKGDGIFLRVSRGAELRS